MKIYDTLSETDNATLNKNKIITWYMCGPTVYDHAHIGHARNYITNDILIRILKHRGYKIFLTMNITDIDDKIIKKSLETYKDPNAWKQISSQYEKSFIEDMIYLNVNMPTVLTRVSDYIPEIIAFIETLIKKGYAYPSPGNLPMSVYFNTRYYYEKDHSDGFDVPLNEPDEDISDIKFLNEKQDKRDFALWKAAKPNEPSWPSPWGNGRPGWHIECSAMSQAVFGSTLTIHSGGVDLKFPHHENERKQCIGHNECSGENGNWPEIFIHIGHLHIDGLKMSKSLKNFITIKDISKKYNNNVLRMFCLMHKYSDPVDFSEEHIDQISGTVKMITDFLARTEYFVKDETHKLCYKKQTQEDIKTIFKIESMMLEIDENLENNFDTVSAIKKVMTMIDIANVNNENYSIISLIYNNVMMLLTMFGFRFDKAGNNNNNNVKLVRIIDTIRNKIRDYAKENKQNGLFKITDEIREELRQNGINLDDKK